MSADSIAYPVTVVDVALPVPDPDNAVEHNERNIQMIMDSFELYGQDQALVLQEGTNKIIKGHGRLEAAQRLGWDQIEVRFVPDDDVTAIGRSQADNRSRDTARWDPAKLKAQASKADLSRWWQPDELERFNIDFPTSAEVFGDDPIGQPQAIEYGSEDNGADAEEAAESKESKLRDDRDYRVEFHLTFDNSIIVDQAIKEAERAEGLLPDKWLTYMASIYLKGWDQFIRLESGSTDTESTPE